MIGVVGADGATGRVAEALRGSGLEASTQTTGEDGSGGMAVLVAIGESALIDLAAADSDAPVLPVGPVDGLPSTTEEAVPAAVEAYLNGETAIREHPLLSVDVGDEPVGRALLDLTLVRSEPGRISEFSLEGGTARSRFRADGVVAATPVGSHGYAHSAGGPRVGVGTDALAVVPIAPFGLGTSSWVVDPAEDLTLRVERDEGDVSLLLDGRERRRLVGPSEVRVSADGSFETVDPPERPGGSPAAGLEKL